LKLWALSALAAIAKSSQVPVKSQELLVAYFKFSGFYINYCTFAGPVSRVLQNSYALPKSCDDESRRGI
jgi:hypothetical protein